MQLLQGYDTFSGNARSKAIKGTAGTPTEGTIQSIARVCTSLEELHTSLQIDASVSASYEAFSGDVKASYLHTLDITSNSVTVLIYACKTTTTGYTGSVTVDPDLTAQLKTEDDVADFVSHNGDSFVSEVTTGSEYIATYVFHSLTVEDKMKVEASLGFKYSGGPTSVDASISTKISNALKTVNVESTIRQHIFGVSTVAAPAGDPDTMIDFANKFSTLSVDAPTTVSFKVEPYEKNLPHAISTLFKPVKANRDSFNNTPAAKGWGGMLGQLEQLNSQCKQVQQVYADYGDYQDSAFEARAAQVNKDWKDLLKLVSDVDDDPTTVPQFTIPVSLNPFSTPSINFSVRPLDPLLDGGGGTPFQDITNESIGRRVRLAKIEVYHGNWVDRLIATYADAVQHAMTPVIHGGGSGLGSQTLELNDDEYIVAMEGYKNGNGLGRWQVGGLKFTTSKGQNLATDNYNPQHDNTWASWSTQNSGGVIVGFAGRSGDALDSIQPMVLRFDPAKWSEVLVAPAS